VVAAGEEKETAERGEGKMNTKWRMMLSAVVMVLMGTALSAKASLAVNFGPGRAATKTTTKPTTLQTGDYNFDGNSTDRRLYGALDSFYITVTYTNDVSNVNNTFYAGAQVVNNNSSMNPEINLYRYVNATGSLQMTTPSSGDSRTTSMGAAFAPTVIKADFLNGLNAVSNLSFSNATGSATLSMNQLVPAGADSTVRLLVKNGDNWFVSGTERTATGSLSVNGYTETWYAYNPSDNLFIDTSALGEGVAGSELTDIQAFGGFVQSLNFNGTTTFANFQFDGFTANLIPEPATIGMLGLGAMSVLVVRRLQK
jgi:hypothetical protein